MYRTIEIGNINEKLVGQTVKIIGWVNKKRDLGGLTFVSHTQPIRNINNVNGHAIDIINLANISPHLISSSLL